MKKWGNAMPDEMIGDLEYLTAKMSRERIIKFRREIDTPLVELSKKIGEGKVIEYLDEIDRTKKPPLIKLADAIGKDKVAQYLHFIDNHEELKNSLLPTKISGTRGSVLSSTNIDDLCQERIPLISPTYVNGFKEGASYELRLGSKYRIRDVEGWLSEGDELHIKPNCIAIVSTYEWLNIPNYLIARWNLKVGKVYTGLVWVGGPQVDPGYQGFLSCPLYNLSNKEQILKFGDGLFIIDFVINTVDTTNQPKIWKIPNRHATFDFQRLDREKIQSAPESDVSSIRNEMSGIRREVRTFEVGVSVILTIIIAVIGIITGLASGKVDWTSGPSIIVFVALGLSVISLIFSLGSRFRK
jgi:deoxycytidine triphosphate deaminase